MKPVAVYSIKTSCFKCYDFVCLCEEHYMLNGLKKIDIGMLKLFLLLYAVDIVIMAETEDGLITGLSL